MHSGADTEKHSQSGFMCLMGMHEGINESMQVWRGTMPGNWFDCPTF